MIYSNRGVVELLMQHKKKPSAVSGNYTPNAIHDI